MVQLVHFIFKIHKIFNKQAEDSGVVSGDYASFRVYLISLRTFNYLKIELMIREAEKVRSMVLEYSKVLGYFCFRVENQKFCFLNNYRYECYIISPRYSAHI